MLRNRQVSWIAILNLPIWFNGQVFFEVLSECRFFPIFLVRTPDYRETQPSKGKSEGRKPNPDGKVFLRPFVVIEGQTEAIHHHEHSLQNDLSQ